MVEYDEDDFPTEEEEEYFFSLTPEEDMEKYEKLFSTTLQNIQEDN